MRQWVIAGLLVKRISDGSVKCTLVPFIVSADDEKGAIKAASLIVDNEPRWRGIDKIKWSLVDTTDMRAASGDGVTFNIGAFTSVL